jgi:hypothetical protein
MELATQAEVGEVAREWQADRDGRLVA